VVVYAERIRFRTSTICEPTLAISRPLQAGLLVTLVVICSVFSTGCASSSERDGATMDAKKTAVGTWRLEDEVGFLIYRFREDGTGVAATGNRTEGPVGLVFTYEQDGDVVHVTPELTGGGAQPHELEIRNGRLHLLYPDGIEPPTMQPGLIRLSEGEARDLDAMLDVRR